MRFWEKFDQWGVPAEELLKDWDRCWDRSQLPYFLYRNLPEHNRLDNHWQRCLAQLLVWLSLEEMLVHTNKHYNADVKLLPGRLPLESVELRVCEESAPAFVDLLREPCGDEGLPYVMVDRSEYAEHHTFTPCPSARHGWYGAIRGHYRLVTGEDRRPDVWHIGQTGSLMLVQGPVIEGECQPTGVIVYPFPFRWQIAAECVSHLK